MRKILVTGGAGFIGAALTNRLVQNGHLVTVLDDFSRGRRQRLVGGSNLRVVEGDIRDREVVAAAMQGSETIFHLAYVQGTQTFYAEPKLVLDIAINGIANVLHACEAQGGKELFLVSSSEVYQVPPAGMVPTDETVPLSVPDVLNPRYSYGGGKIASELMTLAYARSGVLDRVVIARPHNIYGPDMGMEHVIPEFAVRAKRLLVANRGHYDAIEFPVQGTGQETRSFCHIDDCVDALLLLMERGVTENVYHVGTPEEVTITELVGVMAQWYGRKFKVIPGTLPKGSPPRRLPDVHKLELLGYRPKVKLIDGLPAVLLWYMRVD